MLVTLDFQILMKTDSLLDCECLFPAGLQMRKYQCYQERLVPARVCVSFVTVIIRLVRPPNQLWQSNDPVLFCTDIRA